MRQIADSYWINEETSELKLPDKRLEERTRKILYDFSYNPTVSIPQFCPDEAAVKYSHHPTTQGLGPLDNAQV